MKCQKVLCRIVFGMMVILAGVFTVNASGWASPKYGGRVKIAVTKDAKSLGDVLKIYRVDLMMFSLPCVETLLRYDAEGLPTPHLLEGWQESPEKNTITLKLRKGVKFHDGTDFDAEAVKFNLDRYKDSNRSELKVVQGIEVVDPLTVKLVLSKWDNTLLTNLASYPGFMISPTAFENHDEIWVANNPVGTGPFKFKKWTKGVSIKYEKFDGYWQEGKPYLDKLEMVIIKDPMTRIAAFKGKEVDAILHVDSKTVRELSEVGNVKTASTPRAHYTLVPDASHEDSPFADIRVRRAVDHAIDRKAIVENITGGLWEDINQPSTKKMWEHNPNVVGCPYDPAKSKKLLEEAGYPDGFKTTIDLPTADADLIAATTAVQGYLSKVGINAKLELLEISKYLEKGLKGWKGLHFGGGAVAIPDQLSNLKRVYSGYSPHQISGLRPPEIDELILKGLATHDFEAKKKIAHEVMRLYADVYCTVHWLAMWTDTSAWHEYVHDLGTNQIVQHIYTPENAWVDR